MSPQGREVNSLTLLLFEFLPQMRVTFINILKYRNVPQTSFCEWGEYHCHGPLRSPQFPNQLTRKSGFLSQRTSYEIVVLPWKALPALKGQVRPWVHRGGLLSKWESKSSPVTRALRTPAPRLGGEGVLILCDTPAAISFTPCEAE